MFLSEPRSVIKLVLLLSGVDLAAALVSFFFRSRLRPGSFPPEIHMQHFTSEKTLSLSAKTCDRCRRRAEKDDLEYQEFLTIDHRAGYGSVFGDGGRLRLDLCQHCVKEVLGQWLTQRE
ncbi:hypothetical protein ACE2PP_000673 [Salmonella enterica]